MSNKKNNSKDIEVTLDADILNRLTSPAEVWGKDKFLDLKNL